MKKNDKSVARLSREQWLDNSLEILAKRGQSGLQIQKLAEAMDVTRGSFYWHFKNRNDFTLSLFDYWHRKYTQPVPGMVEAAGGTAEEKLLRLFNMVYENDLTRYDLPLRSWAAQDPAIAKLVRRTDRFRLGFIRGLFIELGFTDSDLEVRARTCLACLTLEKSIVSGLKRKDSLKLIKTLHTFFIRQ